MASPSLHDLTYPELERLFVENGIRPAHALTLYQALYQQLEFHPEQRGDFPAPLQRILQTGAPGIPLRVTAPEVAAETVSEDGWTRKFLLRLGDGQTIETVVMGFPGRFTACLSTQVGCAMGCVFCATGHMGFFRHLLPGEIVAQVVQIQRVLLNQSGERLRNLVLMGMGEPLHNFDATMQALETITDTRGLNIGASRITISTVGHVPGIRRLARHPRRYNLAVSLHAATDAERTALIPVARRWPLAELMDACREYAALTGRRLFLAWTLIAGKNDTPDHAHQLVTLIRGMDVHVNLIPLNPTDGFTGTATSGRATLLFQRILQTAGIPSTIRQRRGLDVAAGCGQLRAAM
ncbi:MAG: 23S rRNA (adenine(2503)-C(2))-methyltransferase RlmN [Verrucomicrobiales bacterium]|nr:23S rRNA (adenine(2503)-C(2))-methyltransferase RlmN [Verrucomicrobiales bacterium]